MNFIDIVREICAKNSTDCRSLNKSDLARKLMDMANIPDDAEITEIPLDIDNQVAILFVVPMMTSIIVYTPDTGIIIQKVCNL